ncbi:hypothetical protein C8A01DRAFT_44060 [Parachaetomium inaequale]|uniref:Uncharacterized protein n=1 Tax=Parachaetomium inaequale TaxID=2588326 RepID=A0AAN6PQA0_9PEZI|nr:hypothetical protein C8A01DRAFT_44060 [Parachaetomium inaequale]
MAQQPPLNSNNPFRRKAPAPSAPAAPPAAVPRFADADDTPSPTPGPPPALPPADSFRHQLQALSNPNQPPPATSFQKPKVVKKVRVQSPPPSSPESPGVAQRFPPVSLYDDDSDSSSSSDEADEQVHPFTYASSTGSADVSDRGDELQSIPTHRPPPNPFQKTLRDLEVGATEPELSPGTASGTRGALDVGAFGRLLLTGQAGGPASAQAAAPYAQHSRHPPIPSGDGVGTVDTASASRQSISDTLQAVQETPQTSRETSEHEGEDDRRGLVAGAQPSLQSPPTILKKPPPPPSSRHGKLINPGAARDAKGAAGGQPPLSSPSRRAATMPPASPSRPRPPTPSDVNKPLPLAPQRSPAEEVFDSVFDREAAGKVPEPELQPGLNIIMPPRPPTPPNASHARSSAPVAPAQPAKKPAPPPRRQPHGRSESKAAAGAASVFQQDDTDVSHRRSSVDSTRSRSSSLRASIHAPAPPPPRRPSHPSRGSSSYSVPPSNADADPSPISSAIVASPPPIGDTPGNSSSSSSSNTPGTSTPAPAPAVAATAKLTPPPPPPARNASVRGKRPAARTIPLSSSDVGGKEAAPPPPPPPPPPTRLRDRGGSRGSVEGGGASATTTVPGGLGVDAVARGPGSGAAEAESHAGDILADLDALQREVDALRGQVERAG